MKFASIRDGIRIDTVRIDRIRSWQYTSNRCRSHRWSRLDSIVFESIKSRAQLWFVRFDAFRIDQDGFRLQASYRYSSYRSLLESIRRTHIQIDSRKIEGINGWMDAYEHEGLRDNARIDCLRIDRYEGNKRHEWMDSNQTQRMDTNEALLKSRNER